MINLLSEVPLAGAVLARLLPNALFGWWWADPLASLVIIYYGSREALQPARVSGEAALSGAMKTLTYWSVRASCETMLASRRSIRGIPSASSAHIAKTCGS
jgi:Co/Zn/Cd efflux system component